MVDSIHQRLGRGVPYARAIAARSPRCRFRRGGRSSGGALACARDGKLDSARLDEHQWICYELLALADADLLAGKTLVGVGASASELDSALGAAFTTDAIVSVLGRLQGIYIAMDLDAQPLHRLAAGDDLLRLRRDAAGPEVLAKLGNAVANTDGEIGDVVVDEETAMARDAFRRFAEEVVAPMAEKIHRHDLTVPESLLQPMREMGVFGLSIPRNMAACRFRRNTAALRPPDTRTRR